MIYFSAMKRVNIILLIAIWPMLSQGHILKSQKSLSSMQEAKLSQKGGDDATNYNSTHQVVTTLDDSIEKETASVVSYDFFNRHCNFTGTRLRCDDETTFQGSKECIPLCNSNLTINLEEYKYLQHNLTEAVFRGMNSFCCFGRPMIKQGYLDNIDSLEISNASDEVLESFIEAVRSSKSLQSLTRLTLKANHLLNQDKLNKLFATNVEFDKDNNITFSTTLLPNLELIDLSENDFSVFNLSPFFKISHLILNECRNLNMVTVEGVTSQTRIFSLTILDLSQNPKLQTVSPWIIPSSPKLTSLDLSSNPELRIFPTSFFSNSLLDHVNLKNSSFICDCNIKSYETKFFNHLLEKNCTEANSQETLRTQEFLLSPSCSNNQSSSLGVQKLPNVSAHVNSDVVINCQKTLKRSSNNSISNDDDEPIPTHIAWITPTNDILLWIRQFMPSSSSNENTIINELLENTTMTSEEKDAAFNDGVIDSITQPWDNVLQSECVRKDTYTILSRIVYFGGNYEGRIKVLPKNGSLLIQNMGFGDRGKYRCLAWNNIQQIVDPFERNNITASHILDIDITSEKNNIHPSNVDLSETTRTAQTFEGATIKLKIDTAYRETLYVLSLIYGFATAGGFLLITLLAKLICFLLHNYGCCLFCCCCKDRLPPKAKRIKNAIEAIEAYRTQQLEKLRENYHAQSDWIRQNCANQMERVRDNYSSQTTHLRDFRLYGSTQMGAVRDQYYDQMHRIRDYSNAHLERVNENYIFQRQKLRKFSAQNYMKIKETKKYTQKTLGKAMNNLPALYLDLTACRQGLRERQPSLEWEDDELQAIELGTNLPNGRLELTQDAKERAFNYNTREHMSIQLDPKGTASKIRSSNMAGQDGRDRGSGSVYFTPSSTPLREVSASPTKGTKHLYNSVYQQDDKDLNWSNSNTESGRNAAKRTKPPFIKTHRNCRSFSFPFMPSYWFGSANTPTSNDKLSDVQGDSHCDNENEKVHHVLVEREACGSRDYLDVNSLKDIKEDMANVGSVPKEIDLVKQDTTLDNLGVEYDECDALLPKQLELDLRNLNHNDDNEIHLEEDVLDNSTCMKNEQEPSLSSTSTSNSSPNNSHKDTESSVMGITTETATTSNSELFSNSTEPMVTGTTESSDASAIKMSTSSEYEDLLGDKKVILADKKENGLFKSMHSVNVDELHCESAENLTHKRNSM